MGLYKKNFVFYQDFVGEEKKERMRASSLFSHERIYALKSFPSHGQIVIGKVLWEEDVQGLGELTETGATI